MAYQKNYVIEVVETAAQKVLTCRENMSVRDFGRYYSVLFEKIAREKLSPNGLCGAIYYDQEFNPDFSDIELFVGVDEVEQANGSLPGSLCAKTVHKGAYSSLHDAYGALGEWIVGSEYEHCGAPYNVYVKGRTQNLPPEQWETEVYWPIKRK